MARNAKEKSNEIRLETPVSDFVPFACHYNGSTVLTKNGELLQVIKILIPTDAIPENIANLREEIRNAITANIKSDNFALWFHSVRSRQDISVSTKYPDILSDYINKSWRKKHVFDHRFSTEFFISVIHEGQFLSSKSPSALSFRTQSKSHNKYLEKAHMRLTEAVGGILLSLKGYSARRLEVYEKDGIHYSEPLEFFNKIVNLSSERLPLKESSMADKLTENRVAFGFNACEIRNRDSIRFGCLFSVKEYTELANIALVELFNLPVEIVVSETIDFVSGKLALKDYQYQKYITNLSKDKFLSEVLRLEEVVETNDESHTDYAEHQVTIMMIEDNLAALEKQAEKFIEDLATLGLVAVREDLVMEDCFWSQLPANFAFIRRNSYTPSAWLGSLAWISRAPVGNRTGNRWGNAITILPLKDNTPYFFNFHRGDSGHSLISGPEEKSRNQLLNFLISESMKFKPHIFYFTKNRASEIFLKAIGAKSYSFHNSSLNIALKLNPLQLPDSPENRLFLAELLEFLLTAENAGIPENQQKLFEAVAKIYMLTPDKRRFSQISTILENSGLGSYLENFSEWHSSGKYAHIFDNETDNLSWQSRINHFDISTVASDSTALKAALIYLLYRVKSRLDGTPAIIVMDNLPPMAPSPSITEWLREMTALNCAVIFSGDSFPDTLQTNITTTITLHDKGNELTINQGGSVILAKFDISSLKDIAAMLVADKKALELMEKMIVQSGPEPEKWLLPLVKKVV